MQSFRKYITMMTRCVIFLTMREVLKSQMKLGEVPISNIEFDTRSRDEIPKLSSACKRYTMTSTFVIRFFQLSEIWFPPKSIPITGEEVWTCGKFLF